MSVFIPINCLTIDAFAASHSLPMLCKMLFPLGFKKFLSVSCVNWEFFRVIVSGVYA